MIGKIYRIGIAVNKLDEAIRRFSKVFDLSVAERRVNEAQAVEWAWLPSDVIVELIQATAPESKVSQFLKKRGEGLFLIGIEVSDLEAAMKELKERNVELVFDAPRPFPGGRKHNFIHPKSLHGVLVELVEPARSEQSSGTNQV